MDLVAILRILQLDLTLLVLNDEMNLIETVNCSNGSTKVSMQYYLDTFAYKEQSEI